MKRLAAALLLLAAPMAEAAPGVSPRPHWRAAVTEVVAPVPADRPGRADPPRPHWRHGIAAGTSDPVAGPPMPAAARPPQDPAAAGAGLRAVRPAHRPRRLADRFTVSGSGQRLAPVPAIAPGRSGGLCGLPDLQGTSLAPIPGQVAGCGIAAPVRVTALGGIRLSVPAVMDCTTATALDGWVRRAAIPAWSGRGGGLAGLQVAASYDCRPRNNVKGARMSEHGRGRAIDISGFTLKNGSSVTVLQGWRDGRFGAILHRLHDAACGPFGTVLGPGSDGYHRSHLHLDTAAYRGGAYCR